jgi:thioredoxin 1
MTTLTLRTSTIITLTDENFPSEVLQSPVAVLVYYWAEWCGQCKTIAPLLAELADEYSDRAKIGAINIDEQAGLASEYGIRAVPTLLFLRRGKVADQIVGLGSKADIMDSFDRVIG